MNFKETDKLSREQKLQILEIWNREYPVKVAFSSLAEFEEYLQNLDDKRHVLVCGEEGIIQGWLVHFIRDDERFFTLIVDSSAQGRGWGSELLNRAKEQTSDLNGWVIDRDTELKSNGEAYRSPVEFYKKNDFRIRPRVTTKIKDINGIKVTWKR